MNNELIAPRTGDSKKNALNHNESIVSKKNKDPNLYYQLIKTYQELQHMKPTRKDVEYARIILVRLVKKLLDIYHDQSKGKKRS
jgi:hypothetical protein